jgi:hypothetical protein
MDGSCWPRADFSARRMLRSLAFDPLALIYFSTAFYLPLPLTSPLPLQMFAPYR